MFRNQYLICSEQKPSFQLSVNYRQVKFFEFFVYHSDVLDCTISFSPNISLLILGYIVDPLNPSLQNSDIAKKLTDESLTIVDVFKKMQDYSGRYVLLINDAMDFFAMPDTCAMRQIYFTSLNNQLYISSSPKLLFKASGQEPIFDDDTLNLINSAAYKESESHWYSSIWYDKRVSKVLPNHYLDIHKKKICRIPFYIQTINRKEILKYSGSVLKGSLLAISKRFKTIFQPITAGWDSRVLLAASKELRDSINYYVFVNNDDELKSPDVIVPERLLQKLGMNFKTIKTEPLKVDFLQAFQQEHFFPRILPKTSNIQWHYYHNREKDTVNINGNGGEIARCDYGTYNLITLSCLRLRANRFNRFFYDSLNKWFKDAMTVARETDISVLDLFYWEQRGGGWVSMYPFEQDIAIEEFMPFNHKNLLLSILQVNPGKRKFPDYKFFRELIEFLWPEVLTEPLNPIFGLNLKKRAVAFMKSFQNMYFLFKALNDAVKNKL